MEHQGVSNDTIQALNPIACIIMGPVIQSILPRLRHRGLKCGPIMRMTMAFFFVSAGLAYAAGLQQLIYSRPPCFEYPLECPAATGEQLNPHGRANEVSVWLQTPMQFLLAIGEILGLVSLSEYMYTEAPVDIKAMVQALQDIAAAIAAALGMALGPVSKNPFLVVMYASLAGTMAVCAILFWAFFRAKDVNEDQEAESAPAANEN